MAKSKGSKPGSGGTQGGVQLHGATSQLVAMRWVVANAESEGKTAIQRYYREIMLKDSKYFNDLLLKAEDAHHAQGRRQSVKNGKKLKARTQLDPGELRVRQTINRLLETAKENAAK